MKSLKITEKLEIVPAGETKQVPLKLPTTENRKKVTLKLSGDRGQNIKLPPSSAHSKAAKKAGGEESYSSAKQTRFKITLKSTNENPKLNEAPPDQDQEMLV